MSVLTVGIGIPPSTGDGDANRWSCIPLEETAVLYPERVELIRGLYFSQHLTRMTFFKKQKSILGIKMQKINETKNEHTRTQRGIKELFSDLWSNK